MPRKRRKKSSEKYNFGRCRKCGVVRTVQRFQWLQPTPPRCRKATLRSLGFASYQDYLASQLWAEIRRQVLADNTNCIRCRKPAEQVHHETYCLEVLAGRDRSKLHSICGNCHRKAEFDHRGRKTSLARANRFLGLAAPLKGKRAKVIQNHGQKPIPRRQGNGRNAPDRRAKAKAQPQAAGN